MWSKYRKSLFCHNVRINGLKAIFFAFGLCSWRYVEYGFVLDSLRSTIPPHKKFVLDVGCGYSILTSFLKIMGFQVCAIDVNKMAAKFQHDRGVQAVRASAEKIPFRQKICNVVISMSVLEHIYGDGDIAAFGEISKLLKDKGSLIISLPSGKESYIETDLLWGIPPVFRLIIENIGTKELIFKIFQVFNIEREEGVFQRVYNSQEINRRIMRSSQCAIENKLYICGSAWSHTIYKLIPMSLLSWVEYQLVNLMKVEQESHDGSIPQDAGAIILKFKNV